MENVILKNFLDNFKQFIVDECEKEVGTASSYRSNVKRACEILNLGEGFLEAIAVIADVRVKAALCEFLRAKLSEVIEAGNSIVPKKSIIDCRSAVTKLGEYVVFEEPYEEVETVEASWNIVNAGTQVAVSTAPATVFHPVIALPYESTYTQKDILKKFKSRLSTQDRFYSDGCFPTHLITKINAKRRQLYDNTSLNTKFLYDSDPNKFYRLKDITKLTIKTDGFVTFDAYGQEYDLYTAVYAKGSFVGYERVCVEAFDLLSLDHTLPIRSELPKFLSRHSAFDRFSKSVIAEKRACAGLTVSAFSTYYFENIYPSLYMDEETLLDEITEFIDSLDLVVVHRSYNSSKNDNV